MPTFLRMAEVLFCSMAGFLPYLLLVVYPFRNHLRLKNFLAGLLALIIAPSVLYYDVAAALGTAPAAIPYMLMRSAMLLVFAVLVIHANISKVLLNTCSVINLSFLITGAANGFASPYTTRHLLITVVLQILLLVPYAVVLAKTLAPTLSESDAPVWKLLWIAPAAGTVLGCVMVSAAALPFVMAFAIALAAGAAVLALHKTETEMITLILRKAKAGPRTVADTPVRSMPDPVQLYYSNLQARLAESEHNCKDMLLQVMTMEDDLEHQDYEQLRARLSALRRQLSPDAPSTGNNRIDPIVTYYTRQAMLGGIKMVTNIELPELTAVSDADIAVLISCLLDSALDACREQTVGTRRIATASNLREGLLQIGIKSTYSDSFDSDSEQLNLCRRIAARHGGKLSVNDMDGVVQIVASLNI